MAGSRWWVVIEEMRGAGQGRVWQLSSMVPVGERDAAAALALRLAHEHAPAYPWSPLERRVLRVGEDGYLVIVTGRTSTFHFRVTLGELVDPPVGPPAEERSPWETRRHD
jgi:hypothetical protein